MDHPQEMIKCTTVILQVPTTTLSSYRLVIAIPMAKIRRKTTSKAERLSRLQRRKIQCYRHAMGGRETNLNLKSDGFPFRKLNDFESRNGGRARLKTCDVGGNFGRKSEGFDIGREKDFSTATAEE